jgi:DNA-binding MurR/RpiR family transcriptional regulator
MDRTNTNLIGTVVAAMPGMSKGHRAIARYIVEHYEHAAYMTAARIGDEAGVSESTVVRFAMELGFEGYPHFQRTLQEDLKGRLTAVQRLNASVMVSDEKDVLHSVIQSDLDKLRTFHETVDQTAFDRAVGMVLEARRIYILGVRSSAPLAAFLGFYFNLIFENVRLVHTTSVSEMFEQILPAGPGDVVIAISFPRYSKRTIKAMTYARTSGASVVAITDKPETPVSRNADCCLLAPSDMASFVDSLVAPLSLINALIVAVGLKRRDHVGKTFEKLERIWDDYQVYEKDDGNAADAGRKETD